MTHIYARQAIANIGSCLIGSWCSIIGLSALQERTREREQGEKREQSHALQCKHRSQSELTLRASPSLCGRLILPGRRSMMRVWTRGTP